MIDIHAHILPGLDDGSDSPETSLMMAYAAVESGVTAIIATPHCNQRGFYENYASPELTGRLERLRGEIKAAGIPLEVYQGMEVFGTRDVPRLLREGKLLTLNGSRYLLIEFAFREDPLYMDRLVHAILEDGVIPIVAHPERYVHLQDIPDILYDWVSDGIGVQINKGSLFGKFGRHAQQLAMALLWNDLVTCVASDAHGAEMRTTDLADAQDFLTMEFSGELAERLLTENPRRILSDEPLLQGRPAPFS